MQRMSEQRSPPIITILVRGPSRPPKSSRHWAKISTPIHANPETMLETPSETMLSMVLSSSPLFMGLLQMWIGPYACLIPLEGIKKYVKKVENRESIFIPSKGIKMGLRLLALILCSNCSNTFNKVLTSTWCHTVKLLFATSGHHFSLLNMLHGWSKHFTSRYDPSTPFTPHPFHHLHNTMADGTGYLSVAWHV